MSTSWLIAITWFLWSNVSKQDHMPLNPESRVGLYLPVKSNILTDTKSNWHCLIAYVGFFLGSEFTLQLQMFQKGKMKVIWDLHAVSLLIKIHFHQNSHCCPSSKISIKVRNTSVLWRAKKLSKVTDYVFLHRRIFQIIVAIGNKSQRTTKGTPVCFKGVFCQILNNRNVGFQCLRPPISIYIKEC